MVDKSVEYRKRLTAASAIIDALLQPVYGLWGTLLELTNDEFLIYPSFRPGYVVLDFGGGCGGVVCDRKALIAALESMGDDPLPLPDPERFETEMRELDWKHAQEVISRDAEADSAMEETYG